MSDADNRRLAETLLREGTIQRGELEAARTAGCDLAVYLKHRKDGKSHRIAVKAAK